MNTPSRIRVAHFWAGIAIAVFAILHVGLQLLAGIDLDRHHAWTHTARLAYRSPVLETVLTGLIALQVGSGLAMARRKRSGRMAHVQRFSGMYLAAFLLVHLAAVHVARFRGIESDFGFAAAGFRQPATALFFAPYYFLAVLALCLHVACALAALSARHGRNVDRTALRIALLAGCMAATMTTLALARHGLTM